VVAVFIDFAKAFDSIDRVYMARALTAYGIPPYLIRAALSVYSNPTARVMSSEGLSEAFNLDYGVLQGDTLAPLLFVIVLDYALRRALDQDATLADIKKGQWGFFLRDRKGPRSPALYLTDTDLADDIGLYGTTYEATQRMLDAVIRETKMAGLSINVAKTKYMVRGDLAATSGTITVEGAPIERVDDFKYLGSYVGSVSRDIDERCKAASRAYGRLMPVWKAPLQLQTKLRVFKTMVEPVLFYACETWPLTVAREKRLTSHWFKLIRQIVNRRWPYVRQTDESILLEFNLKSPAQTLRDSLSTSAMPCAPP
jgi:hypothetical protein